MRAWTVCALAVLVLSGSQPLPCNSEPSVGSSANKLERRGCCSHHGGVCGCEKGRALCCDGQLSPSCGCSKPVRSGSTIWSPSHSIPGCEWERS
jgi:hypothetical protein